MKKTQNEKKKNFLSFLKQQTDALNLKISSAMWKAELNAMIISLYEIPISRKIKTFYIFKILQLQKKKAEISWKMQ